MKVTELPSQIRTCVCEVVVMRFVFALLVFASPLAAQPESQFAITTENGAKTIRITNVEFELVEQRLLLRKISKSRQVVGDMGEEASVVVEAWPMESSLKQKPLYRVAVSGMEPRVVRGELLQVSRGLEEVEWWSLYKLADGAHLFDTYVPPVIFSISKDTQQLRYVGLEVQPDDTPDTRLKAPGVVGVLTYASAKGVISEALITCDDPQRATLLRSYADSFRKVQLTESEQADGQPQILVVSISQFYPSAPATVSIGIPISGDKLDVVHAKLPAGLRIREWRRKTSKY
jgi:hypothetical protein